MFKVEDKTGSQVLINPLQISYIREVSKRTIEIVLAGPDPEMGMGSSAATVRVATEGRDPRLVLADWELQLDRWLSKRA